jgi:antitoxin component of MazEF toxin-antitoxin module
MGQIQFRALLQPRGPAAAVILDDTQVAAVGEGAKRFPVTATVNDFTWRTSVTRMGGEFALGFPREVREKAGVQAGDEIDVTLALDTEPRTVEVPPMLAEALAADPIAAAAFEGMAFTHRKEYARWITEAKKDETRQRRAEQAVTMIRAGETRS